MMQGVSGGGKKFRVLMNLVSPVVGKLEQWAVVYTRCLSHITQLLLGIVSFTFKVAALGKASSEGAFEGSICLGNLDDIRRNRSAATQDISCKFRSRFAANALLHFGGNKRRVFFKGQVLGNSWTTEMKNSDAFGKVEAIKNNQKNVGF